VPECCTQQFSVVAELLLETWRRRRGMHSVLVLQKGASNCHSVELCFFLFQMRVVHWLSVRQQIVSWPQQELRGLAAGVGVTARSRLGAQDLGR